MIEELTQSESTKVLKIRTEVVSISTTYVAEESSQPGELPEELPSTSPQPGKISEFDILTLVVTVIVVMAADGIIPTQAEEPIISIGVEDIPVEISTEKALTVEPILMVTTHEIIFKRE